jgi:hypothetical protein
VGRVEREGPLQEPAGRAAVPGRVQPRRDAREPDPQAAARGRPRPGQRPRCRPTTRTRRRCGRTGPSTTTTSRRWTRGSASG